MDIDGTLLDLQGRMPPANVLAVQEAASRRNRNCAGDRASVSFALPVANLLPCDLHLITNNGALTKSRDGRTLAKHLLPLASARVALDATREFRDCASVMFDRPGAGQVILEKIVWDHPLRAKYFQKNSMFLSEQTPLENCLNGEDPIQVGFTGKLPAAPQSDGHTRRTSRRCKVRRLAYRIHGT